MKKADIFRVMWTIYKNNTISRAEALKKAWAISRLITDMHTHIVEFDYVKANRIRRKAYGTLVWAEGSKKRHNPDIVTYYDIQKGEWRSFRVDRFIGAYAKFA